MVDFLLAVCLFLMILAGFGSLLFASPRLPAVLWNFFWYWVIGNTAIRVFDSSHAGWLGVAFAVLYILRARRVRSVVFRAGGDVIEAEVVETQSTPGKAP